MAAATDVATITKENTADMIIIAAVADHVKCIMAEVMIAVRCRQSYMLLPARHHRLHAEFTIHADQES